MAIPTTDTITSKPNPFCQSPVQLSSIKKTSQILTVFLLIFVGSSQIVRATDYYLSPTGNDANTGRTRNQAWRTFNYAIKSSPATAGDTIYVLGGVYNEGDLLFNQNHAQGSNGNYLTIKNAAGETPILNNTALRFKDQNYLHIEGLTFENVRTVSLASGSQNRPIQGLRIINNTFRNNSSTPTPDTTHIRASTVGGPTTQPTTYLRYQDVIIQGNRILEFNTNLEDDAADALQVEGNVDYLTIADNYLEYNTSIAIGIAGRTWKNDDNLTRDSDDPNPDQSDYVLVKGNTVRFANSNGIYLDAPGNFVTVENNTVEGARQNGLVIAGESVTTELAYQRIIVRRNVLVNNYINLNIGGKVNSQRQDPTDCNQTIQVSHVVAVHNTIFKDSGSKINLRLGCLNQFTFANNIIADQSTSTTNFLVQGVFPFASAHLWDLDTNHYYSGTQPKDYVWLGQSYSTLSAYQTQSGQEAHSIETNPRFTNSSNRDFTLTTNSPARNEAQPLTYATQAGNNSSQITVANATFFSSGYNLQPGDSIVIGTNQPVQITQINYTNNRLTLSQPLSWTAQSPVYYPYQQSAPDLGAVEFASSSTASPTPLPSTTPTSPPTTSPTPSYYPGDVNGDNQVNLTDYNVIISNFSLENQTRAQGDLTGDGRVDLLDYNQVISHFGTLQ